MFSVAPFSGGGHSAVDTQSTLQSVLKSSTQSPAVPHVAAIKVAVSSGRTKGWRGSLNRWILARRGVMAIGVVFAI